MMREQILDHVYLTYIPSEKFKTSFLSMQLAAPLRRESAGQNALLVNVLSRGTARCPDLTALGRELDLLYGANLEPTVRKKGESQLFGFVASCIDDRYLSGGERLLEQLTDLMGEMLCAPALEEGRLNGDYVSGERENLADLIRSGVNDKRAYAARRLIEEMCREEPYGTGRMGSAPDVEAVTREELDRHYRALLPRARLELFYCGCAERERVADSFRRALADLPRGGRPEPAPTLRRPAPTECRVVTEAMDVSQGKLCMGFRTDCGDVPANMLMNAIFGGGSSSKLFLNVREKLSLCYYAGSSYHRLKGLVTVSSGIAFENYDRAVEEITAQLEAMQRGVWEAEELENAKRFLCSALRSTEDSAGALEDFFMGQAVAGDRETLPELEAAIAAVTEERVAAAASALRPDTIYFLRGREDQP